MSVDDQVVQLTTDRANLDQDVVQHLAQRFRLGHRNSILRSVPHEEGRSHVMRIERERGPEQLRQARKLLQSGKLGLVHLDLEDHALPLEKEWVFLDALFGV